MTDRTHSAARLLLARRRFIGASLGLGLGPGMGLHVDAATAAPLKFPRDAGSHPDHATEWWYVTGYIQNPAAELQFGFQVTFFRSRVAKTQGMQSRMAARQLVFAHAAVTDVQGKKLWHDQRMARSSGAEPGQNPLDMAAAGTADTNITLQDWSLNRLDGDLQARVQGADFSLALRLVATQPVLLQGIQGLSQKGPEPHHTSCYYSLPHLQVDGDVVLRGQRHAVGAGSTAWLDHEWSQQIMPPQAVGWDWIGINLFDGSALTAFRLRDRQGNAVWDGGSFRTKSQQLFVFRRAEVAFKALRTWKSATSQATYPVEWMVRTPADFYTVRAVLDNQEMDSRLSTGAIYWEGLCEVWDSNQKPVGRGYLEMTGYAAPMRV